MGRPTRSGNPLLDAALGYANLGFHVLPIFEVRGNGCACACGKTDCRSPGKHPRVAGGLNSSSVDPQQIATWWKQWPNANVGIRTGRISGIAALDIDDRKNGDVVFTGARSQQVGHRCVGARCHDCDKCFVFDTLHSCKRKHGFRVSVP